MKVKEDQGVLLVHNRTAAKAKPLIEKGAEWVDSPAEIGQQCSIAFSCVFSDTALTETFTSYLSGKPQKGSIYVDCSTVYPNTIRKLDAKAKAAGLQPIRLNADFFHT